MPQGGGPTTIPHSTCNAMQRSANVNATQNKTTKQNNTHMISAGTRWCLRLPRSTARSRCSCSPRPPRATMSSTCGTSAGAAVCMCACVGVLYVCFCAPACVCVYVCHTVCCGAVHGLYRLGGKGRSVRISIAAGYTCNKAVCSSRIAASAHQSTCTLPCCGKCQAFDAAVHAPFPPTSCPPSLEPHGVWPMGIDWPHLARPIPTPDIHVCPCLVSGVRAHCSQ